MVWNAQNLFPLASGNHAAYSAPNHAAYSAPNHAAYSAPNHAAYSAPNHAAYSAPNHAAYSAPNHAAYSAPNHAAYPGSAGPVWAAPAPGTGAGGSSGAGFLGGYGPVARAEYATPAALGPVPWTLDFAVGNGWPAVPVDQRINPYAFDPPLQWQTGDWDPGLRFWSLPFDDQLTEWLQDLNLGTPAVMAAREFASRSNNSHWLAVAPGKQASGGLQSLLEDDEDLIGWRAGAVCGGRTVTSAQAWVFIQQELTTLVDLMRDDRLRYLPEIGMQSAHIVPYYVHLMGIDPASKPWTMELMNCATAIANLTKMHYKSVYRRVRPSFLCPGLTPPWGPPQHPAFPSGHAMVAHLVALFLLSVPGIAQRFGLFDDATGIGRAPKLADFDGTGAKRYGEDQKSPLLWLAWRVAKGRERLGVHYPSDSAASRKLAAGLWDQCVLRGDQDPERLTLPTLHKVLAMARAEWPEATAAAPMTGGPATTAA
jgi:hypothetical protein